MCSENPATAPTLRRSASRQRLQHALDRLQQHAQSADTMHATIKPIPVAFMLPGLRETVRGIPNMIQLLESKGIRVFSLTEEVRDVDAFCTWNDGTPFVFLNTLKSAERNRFDAAHELAHLVRDIYSMQHEQARSPDIERQADAFASAFLMPRESVIANQPPTYTHDRILDET